MNYYQRAIVSVYNSTKADVKNWQSQTFPGATAESVKAHLLKELDELEKAEDKEYYDELADCFILAFAYGKILDAKFQAERVDVGTLFANCYAGSDSQRMAVLKHISACRAVLMTEEKFYIKLMLHLFSILYASMYARNAAQHDLYAMLGKITNSIRSKMEINRQRKWGQPDEKGIVEHVKEAIEAHAPEKTKIVWKKLSEKEPEFGALCLLARKTGGYKNPVVFAVGYYMQKTESRDGVVYTFLDNNFIGATAVMEKPEYWSEIPLDGIA